MPLAHWHHDGAHDLEPTNVESAVKASCILLCVETSAAAHYCPAGYAHFCHTFGNACEGSWQQEPAVGAVMLTLQGAQAHKLQLLCG